MTAFLDLSELTACIRAVAHDIHPENRVAYSHSAPWKARCWNWRAPHEGNRYGHDLTPELLATDSDIRGTIARWSNA